MGPTFAWLRHVKPSGREWGHRVPFADLCLTGGVQTAGGACLPGWRAGCGPEGRCVTATGRLGEAPRSQRSEIFRRSAVWKGAARRSSV